MNEHWDGKEREDKNELAHDECVFRKFLPGR
jgi:hypothetical protein